MNGPATYPGAAEEQHKALSRLIGPHVDFEIEKIDLLGSGTDSTAYLINDNLVFRIAHNDNAVRTLAKEMSVLPVLARDLPARTPDLQYMAFEAHDLSFSGYEVLRGEPLTAGLFFGLERVVQDRILEELYEFLMALHAIPPGSVEALNEEKLTGAYNGKQRRLHHELSAILAPEEVREIEGIFESYERSNPDSARKSAVIHADLKPAHVLVDEVSGHLTGVIDWGDSCLGDPDFDFACIQRFFGEKFFRRVLERTPPADQRRIVHKVPFFILIRALQDVLYDRAYEDERSVMLGLRALREHLKSLLVR